jgi:hypothetical protein
VRTRIVGFLLLQFLGIPAIVCGQAIPPAPNDTKGQIQQQIRKAEADKNAGEALNAQGQLDEEKRREAEKAGAADTDVSR